ncbi:MAG: hypothetical protein ACJ797_27760, partial [Ktedonobacteraceae bacterium]
MGKASCVVGKTRASMRKTAKMEPWLLFLRRKADKKEQAEKACQTRPPSKRKVDQILREMNAWNACHPQATFLQIEEKARELVSQLEAHLIQASALEREPEEWSQGEPSQRPSCPRCQVPLLSRGKRLRHVQAT